MTPDDTTPELHIDTDWKAEAQAEKERLSEQEKSADGAPGGQQPMPEASFRTLMSMLAQGAVYGLGAVQDPKTGGIMIDLGGRPIQH